MTIYYVAPSPLGNNANNGLSPTTPFASISFATGRSYVVAGDEIRVLGVTQTGWPTPTGIFRENVPGKSGVAIRGEAGHNIIISALDIVGGWSLTSDSTYQTAGMNWTANNAQRPAGNNMVYTSVPGQLPVAIPEARWPKIPAGKTFFELTRDDWASADSATVPPVSANDAIVSSTITDADLASLPDLVGAKITVLAGGLWTPITGDITAHNGSTITFSHKYKVGVFYQVQADSRYFIFGKQNLLTTPGEWFKDETTGTLYLRLADNSNPTTKRVEVKRRDILVDFWSRVGATLENVTLVGGRINGRANDGQNTFKNIRMWHPTHYNLVGSWYEYSGQAIFAGPGSVVENVTIENCAGSGILAYSSTVKNCTLKNITYNAASGGGVVCNGANMVVEDCVLTGFGGARQIDVQPTCTGISVRRNKCSDSSRIALDEGPIFVYRGFNGGAAKGWITDNIVTTGQQLDNGAKYYYGCSGLYVENAQNLVVARNIFQGGCNFALVHATAGTTLAVEIYHNIFDGAHLFWRPSTEAGYSYAGTSFQNNYFRRIKTGTSPRSDMVFTNNASKEFAYTGNIHTPDPKFDAEWKLLADSPLINAGIAITGINDGFVGTAPDIGVYEYIPPTPAPSPTPEPAPSPTPEPTPSPAPDPIPSPSPFMAFQWMPVLTFSTDGMLAIDDYR